MQHAMLPGIRRHSKAVGLGNAGPWQRHHMGSLPENNATHQSQLFESPVRSFRSFMFRPVWGFGLFRV